MGKKALLFFLFTLFFFPEIASASFGVETDLSSINFGIMKPNEIKGDVPHQGVTVRCTTDQGNAWFLRIRADSPFRNTSNPSSVIPNENFLWYGLNTTGSGALVTGERDFSTERIVYQAPQGEGAEGVDIKLRFKLNIPRNTQSGDYVTTVILTFIE